jgi:glycosyltransferase involved in cell wall biosynthesis
MKSLALIRGKFLNAFDMQTYEPLIGSYDITAFGSYRPFHTQFAFPTERLWSPMDIPDFPYKMQILNRLFVDAHHLFGIERALEGFDIVDTAETYFYFTKQAIDAKRQGKVKKVVVHVDENIPFNNEGIWGRKRIKRYVQTYADHFIAISKLSKQALVQEGVAEHRVSVVGYGIDTARFIPLKSHWKQLSTNTHPLSLVFVGRLEIEKGVFEIIEAIRALSSDKTIPTFHVTCVGEGKEKNAMQTLIHSYGLESLFSFRTASYADMPSVYAHADVMIAPSKRTKTWMEQYNIALLEAQSMGLPIVTTKSGAIGENVGDCALFCKEGDSQSLFQQIQTFVKNPALRVLYGKKARARAEHVHDVHRIAGKLRAIYQS